MKEKNKNYKNKQKEAKNSEESKPQKPSKKKSRNKEFARITYIFVGLFMTLIGYIVYINVVRSDLMLTNPYNTRADAKSLKVARGKIMAGDGTVLAESVETEDSITRQYPYGELYAHIIGYTARGKTGTESLANKYLMESSIDTSEKIVNEFKGLKNDGDNVVTTLNPLLQQTAYDALGDYKGAVVVLEPSTGKILSLVSKPGFDPNQIDAVFDTLDNGELYNNATQGQYPPGSTFKIATALAYMRYNPDYSNYSYRCNGSVTKGDLTIKCYGGTRHGKVDFATSFAKSCNASFVNMAMEMDAGTFQSTSEDLLFNSELPLDLLYNKSNVPVNSKSSLGQRMMTGIGQAETTASPMHMAMIASAVANNGMLMKPYVLDRVEDRDGTVVEQFEAESYKELMTTEEAAALASLMDGTVSRGTGSTLKSNLYTAAGKTGTAENSTGKDHSWFVGYAGNEERQIAVAVIAEQAGDGSKVAVPIAKQIFDAYYN